MKKSTWVLIAIILFGAFIRLFKLGEIPNGLQQDETSLGYNAYSILKTEKDEHGVFLPQNFQAFGEYKLPGYIYATVPSIFVFGFTPFAIRFPSALAGILSLVSIYVLTKFLFQVKEKEFKYTYWSDQIPYIVTALVAINPWHIHFSRAAFEVMLANFFLLTGVYFLLSGLKKQKFITISAGFVCGAAALYTYNIARLFVPLFYAGILVFQWQQWKQLSRKSKSFAAVTLFICLLPFIMGIVTSGGADSTAGTLIFTSAKVQSQLQEIRSYFVGLPPLIGKIFFNYWTLTGWYYMNNIAAHISTSFYFIDGSDHGNNAIGTQGQWYLFELPLFIVGLYWLWQNKKYTLSKLLLFWIILLILVSSLTREAPQATRTFFLLFPVSLLNSIGVVLVWRHLLHGTHSLLNRIVIALTIVYGIGSILFYFLSYSVRFPIYYAKHWRTADRDIVNYIKTVEHKFEKIVIDANCGLVYTSLLTYMPIDPLMFHQALWTTPDSEGFTIPISFGKYEIRPIAWDTDAKKPHTLIITNQTDIPASVKKLETIYYPKRPIVINKGQEIYRYPVEEIGYLAVTTTVLP